MVTPSILVALLADRWFGEIPRFHPLVGFGRLANRVEALSRRLARAPLPAVASAVPPAGGRPLIAGAFAWAVLILLPTALFVYLHTFLNVWMAMFADVVVLYFCIGGRSLAQHAAAVARPLYAGDMEGARQQLSRIVSRDTAHLDAQSIIKATIESVLENGSDAVLAPLFWFAIAGAPGALCYRLCNTLDAMWGYRNDRYLHFGRTAARMDDVLNWFPARCCALSYALAGRVSAALRCWHSQAPMWDSPSAGPVMAAGAGAMGVLLGGPARYDDVLRRRPNLGEGAQPQLKDIEGSLALLRRATGIWVVVIALFEGALWYLTVTMILPLFWASLWA